MDHNKQPDILDVAPEESGKKRVLEPEINHLRAWSFFLFFLPYCRKQKSADPELDNWFANQGLLNLIGWAAAGAITSTFFWGGWVLMVAAQIFNLLILANAFYGTISFYQGKRVKMGVYGDIKIIKSTVDDPR
jgi:hypothetical protein